MARWMRQLVVLVGLVLSAALPVVAASAQEQPPPPAAPAREKPQEPQEKEKPAQRPRQRPRRSLQDLAFGKQPGIDEFKLTSPSLTSFAGRDVEILAGVVAPLDMKPAEQLPVVYNVHGFGGCHRMALLQGPELQQQMQAGTMPRMLYVFLHGMCASGHHEFADSANNGPWGRALTQEFIPELEKECGGVGEPWARFVTGHSSGGWSSLWLQITYPDVFGGCWSTAPDPVDFRDFTGVDIYGFDNAFADPDGQPIMLMRRNGKFVVSIRQFVEQEHRNEPTSGQFYSFNAVFSPRAEDGTPMPLFDWQTGKVDPAVASAWRKYDIALTLTEHWPTLGPKLRGRLHVYVGTLDTFRLEGAVHLLKEVVDELGSDAEIVFAEGRDHGTLSAPEPDLWPRGMMDRIHHEMFASYEQHAATPTAR